VTTPDTHDSARPENRNDGRLRPALPLRNNPEGNWFKALQQAAAAWSPTAACMSATPNG